MPTSLIISHISFAVIPFCFPDTVKKGQTETLTPSVSWAETAYDRDGNPFAVLCQRKNAWNIQSLIINHKKK